MIKRFTYNKNEKLKSRKLIDQLFSEGQSFVHFPLRVLYTLSAGKCDGLKAGFTVSAKNFRKAVDRNRIKRIMREAYRLQKPLLAECLERKNCALTLFIIYTGKELPDYHKVYDKMGTVLNRLNILADETFLANT